MKAQGKTIHGQRWIVLSGSKGDSVGRLRVKADYRVELAMFLLGLEGDDVEVKIRPPKIRKKV